MNARTALLGLFVALTIAFASTTVYESGIRTTFTSTSTSTSTQTTTATSTSTATTTVTSLSTQTVTQTLPAQCLGGGSNSSFVSDGYFGTLNVGASSPAIICLQLYEFDANSSFVVNATRLINIEGVNLETGQTFHGFSNFTITASSGSIDLGGPTNANEGIVVALAITAKPGASGTYWWFVTQGQNPPETAVPTDLGYQQALYLSDQGGADGGPYGLLVAGTGQPEYASGDFFGGYLGCTAGFHIQGVSYNICPDNLYFRIIGATNSTQ
ncbi:MAG: hypothetical protein ACRD6W_08075 [Nitrososphaerales archaeon]